MKTDDLIEMLATGPDVALERRPAGINVLLVAGALTLSGILMALTLGLRPQLAQAAMLPGFWLKVVFSIALAGSADSATDYFHIPAERVVEIGAQVVI